MENIYIKRNCTLRNIISTCVLIVLGVFFGNIDLVAQDTKKIVPPNYVLSRIRALDRDQQEQKLASQTRDATPIAPLTAKEKYEQLIEQYKAEGFTVVRTPAEAIVPIVTYHDKENNETDKYRFYTGRIGKSDTDTDSPHTFRHIGNVNKWINGQYQMTIYGNGNSASTSGYNILTEEQAQNLEDHVDDATRVKGVMKATELKDNQHSFLYRSLPSAGHRGPSHEIILLSYPPIMDNDSYNKQANLKGVHETRMYPDDYIPNIYTEYKFHFADDHDGNAYFVYHIDSKFGEEDRVPVYRQANKRGMYMEANKFGDTKIYRFNYTIPKLRGREPKQYMGALYNVQTYKPFQGLKTGDGGEIAKSDTLLANEKRNTDAGMYFKNKGRHFVSGEVFTTTLVQGVSAIILPELEFEGGFLDFDVRPGQDFDMEAVDIVWIDTNAGDKSDNLDEPDDNISLGGTVKYIKMDGLDEVGDWVTVGTYSRSDRFSPTTGDIDYLTNTSHIIPASKLQVGRNVFKFTITNNVRQMGEIVNTTNIYIVTIDVPYVSDVVYKTLTGANITPPVGYETHFEGKTDETYHVIFPKKYGAYEFVNTTPTLVYESLNETDNRIEIAFEDQVEQIVLNYFANQVDVTISFRRKGTRDGRVYKDIATNLDYVEDYRVSVEPGKNIEDVILELIDSGVIKLNLDEYNPVAINDYEVIGMANKPIVVPNEAINIVYKYSGKRVPLQ